MTLVLQVFGHKPKFCTNSNFDLMVKNQWITRVIRIPPVATMNVFIKFHGNPSYNCNLMWNKVVDQQNNQHHPTTSMTKTSNI